MGIRAIIGRRGVVARSTSDRSAATARSWVRTVGCAGVVSCAALAIATCSSVQPFPVSLEGESFARSELLDRSGRPLSVTYQNTLNGNLLPLHAIPKFLQHAIIEAEDRRFYTHRGVDWLARLSATRMNLTAWRTVRGARTITEQVVRILHPRPSSLWTRWIEGFEARALEQQFSKQQILEFYLNQVPYSAQRRGVGQAARLYFGRDLSTLSTQELLALAVLPRAPSRLSRPDAQSALNGRVLQLASHLVQEKLLDSQLAPFHARLVSEVPASIDVEATHFVGHVRRSLASASDQFSPLPPRVHTTLDADLQQWAQALLDSRVVDLTARGVSDGALLIADHRSNQILAWVNARNDFHHEGSQIDAVLTVRQPGSTLKPFLFAAALEKGWTAATLLDDAPLFQSIRLGIHQYRNYSRIHYGPIRLREALGNSLNIPAILAVRFVGPEQFLIQLNALGFASLNRPIADYGEGLALGNGEVSLLELVQAFATLARGGEFRELEFMLDRPLSVRARRVFSPQASSLIADILADPEARRLEFGAHGVLSFPTMTAVKTGTSNDFRDSWAVGFSDRFSVGVWMGNLDRKPTDEVSGARGPALVLRATFQRLEQLGQAKRLPRSPDLIATPVCAQSGLRPAAGCPAVDEWFLPNTAPSRTCTHVHESEPVPRSVNAQGTPRMLLPSPGLRLAKDPRIPDESEAFAFAISPHPAVLKTEWVVNGQVLGVTGQQVYRWLWPVERGQHNAQARIWLSGIASPVNLEPVPFTVR